MSGKVQGVPIEDISQKWELAQRMSGHTKAPEQALKSVFKEALQKIEETANTKFDPSMTERVWQVVSKEKLQTLKETLLLEFCKKILCGFEEDEVDSMLEEHKKTGSVKNSIYVSYLKKAHALNQDLIVNAVIQKADSMSTNWMPEIVDAVRKEGIQLPDPANSSV